MNTNHSLDQFKDSLGLKKVPDKSAQNPTSSSLINPTPPAFNMDTRDASERLRATLLVAAAGVGIAILVFQFFGREWASNIIQSSEGGYVQILVAVFITLILVSIISAIFRTILRAASFAENRNLSSKTSDPIFKIISGFVFLILALTIFNYIFSFLPQNEFYKKMEGYLEQGIQITTDEGEKTLKLEGGKFLIEDAN